MNRPTTPRPHPWLLALTALALIALVVPAATQASPAKAVPSRLLLWNKLGSDDEVASERRITAPISPRTTVRTTRVGST